MAYNLIVIDNFYSNPEEIREFALKQEFNVRGNYPGLRTVPFLADNLKEYINSYIREHHGEIIWPSGEYHCCGSYQYTTAYDRTWIHSDGGDAWAGVWYGTPNAPISSGTGFFRHKETGLMKHPRNENGGTNEELLEYLYQDDHDYTKWDKIMEVGNIFNRLVIYNGDYFHTSLDYFGRDKYDGRLFQTFFFNTHY